MKFWLHVVLLFTLFVANSVTGRAQIAADKQARGNKPARLEWFRDLGFGMFIHWNVDGTLIA